MMKYKGYHAEVTYDHEAAVFHGGRIPLRIPSRWWALVTSSSSRAPRWTS